MSTAESQHRSDDATRIVLMGVSGCGKTTVGLALGCRLGVSYRDGDDLHSPENIAKMSRGEPLTDDDRWPWLARVGQALSQAGTGIVVGCSALKRRYRDRIRQVADGEVIFVHLAGSRDLVEARLAARSGHFMPAGLLDSQFASLEPPGSDERAVTVDIGQPLDDIVAHIANAILKEQAR